MTAEACHGDEYDALARQFHESIAEGQSLADTAKALRFLASSDDVAGSGETTVRNKWGVRGTGAYDERATVEEAELVLVPRVVAERFGIAYATPTTQAPREETPEA